MVVVAIEEDDIPTLTFQCDVNQTQHHPHGIDRMRVCCNSWLRFLNSGRNWYLP